MEGIYELNEQELMEVNGGFPWAAAVIGGAFLLGTLKGCSAEKRENE